MRKTTPDFDTTELEIETLLVGRTTVCPPLHALLALEQDALPAELAEPARAHLAVCALCTMLLADMASLPEPEFFAGQQERIAAALPTTKARSPFLSTSKGLLSVAAVLLVMAGTFFLIRGARKPEVASLQQARTADPSQPREIPFAPLASPGGSEGLLTRGGGKHTEPSNEELLPAFRAYNRADYSLAAKQFEALSTEYPQSQMILLYLGVSQLALHRDSEADRMLGRAREADRPYDADAVQWYRAVAASRVHPADAQQLLDELCQKKASAYSTRSCDALR